MFQKSQWKLKDQPQNDQSYDTENETIQNTCDRVSYLDWSRGRSRTAATSKMKRFLIIVYSFQLFINYYHSFQLLTIITKHSILDVAAVLDPPLLIHIFHRFLMDQETTR